jgi:hypothetical protein
MLKKEREQVASHGPMESIIKVHNVDEPSTKYRTTEKR